MKLSKTAIIVFVLVITLLSSALFVAATHTGSGAIMPALTSIAVGDTTQVTISVNNPGGASFIGLDLTYDINVLSVDRTAGLTNPDITFGTIEGTRRFRALPAAPISFTNIDANTNRLRFGVDDGALGTLPSGTFDVATITFTGVAAGTSPLGLTFVGTDGITESHDGQITVTDGGSGGNPCDGVTCLNSGSCSAGSCACVGGFTGDRCQTAPATCSDGTQNQGETGVDCGGPCAACTQSCTENEEVNVRNCDCDGQREVLRDVCTSLIQEVRDSIEQGSSDLSVVSRIAGALRSFFSRIFG
jgi:hypothetical protein